MNNVQTIASMIGLGLTAGVLGGLFGIGGGLIMVPALVILFGLDPKTATGTSLMAQLLPVGILGVWEYHQRGEVKVVAGLWIALGLVLGVLAGAKLTGLIPPGRMKQLYGGFLVVIGLYFLFFGGWKPTPRSVPPASAPTTVPTDAS